MPIDLADYTPKKRQHLKEVGAYCIYVIGPIETGPMKIGYAFDVVQRFAHVQTGNWERLFIYHVLWCPGKPIAIRVENEIHAILQQAKRKISGEWFDLDLEWSKRTVQFVARKLYPTAVFLSHGQMIDFLRKKQLDRCDAKKSA